MTREMLNRVSGNCLEPLALFLDLYFQFDIEMNLSVVH